MKRLICFFFLSWLISLSVCLDINCCSRKLLENGDYDNDGKFNFDEFQQFLHVLAPSKCNILTSNEESIQFVWNTVKCICIHFNHGDDRYGSMCCNADNPLLILPDENELQYSNELCKVFDQAILESCTGQEHEQGQENATLTTIATDHSTSGNLAHQQKQQPLQRQQQESGLPPSNMEESNLIASIVDSAQNQSVSNITLGQNHSFMMGSLPKQQNGTLVVEDVKNTTLQNVDINNSSRVKEESVINCKLIGVLPFTSRGHEIRAASFAGKTPNFPYTHLAAALMAVDDFNNRNDSIVPNLEEKIGNCTVRLPEPFFVNSNGDRVIAAMALMKEANNVAVAKAFGNNDVGYCGIVGGWNNWVAMASKSIAAGMDVPMVTHGAFDSDISHVVVGPRVANVFINLRAQAETVVSWFRKNGRDDFLAVVCVTAEYGKQFQRMVENAARNAGFRYLSFYYIEPPFIGFEVGVGVGYALKSIKESGYRNIFLVATSLRDQLFTVADYAEQFGLNKGDHVWMISGNSDPAYLARMASDNDNVAKLARGMVMVRPIDSFTVKTVLKEEDPFLRSWRDKDAEFVRRVNALHPIQDPTAKGHFQPNITYFQKYNPEYGAGFMYDAVMAQALGRCQQQQTEREKAASNPPPDKGPPPAGERAPSNGEGEGEAASNNGDSPIGGGTRRRRIKGQVSSSSSTPTPVGNGAKSLHQTGVKEKKKSKKGPPNPHLEGIIATKFKGATGEVAFKDAKYFYGSRNRATATYGAFNFRAIEPSEAALDPTYTTWYYLTDVLTNGTIEGKWTPTSHAPFVYASGLITPPLLNVDISEQNYISHGVRVMGLSVFVIAAVLSLASLVLVIVNRKKNVFLQSQPTFMCIMLIGCLILSTAILTFSFDEGAGWSDQMLDYACMASPWLVSVGYNFIYSVLVCKLWRINNVLQATRRKVRQRDAIGPFLVVVVCNIIVLLVWTLFDPLTWVRTTIDVQSREEYGRCTSEHGLVFLIALASLMASTTVACGFMAWKTKDIDERFAESKWIFYTIFVQIQILLLGVPVMVILDTASANATYLGRIMLIFLYVVTTITMMVGPKVVKLLPIGDKNKSDRTSEARSSAMARGSVIGGGVRVTGIAPSAKLKMPDSFELSADSVDAC